MGWIPLLLILAVLLIHVFLLPRQLAACVGLEFGYRLLISGVLLVPLGFLMGMPFPTGLRVLATSSEPDSPASSENTIEWAWAMNAAASVLGSVLAMVIAIQFGLTVTLACGAVAYVLALFIMPVLGAKAPWTA
jgi:hypothetical protein